MPVLFVTSLTQAARCKMAALAVAFLCVFGLVFFFLQLSNVDFYRMRNGVKTRVCVCACVRACVRVCVRVYLFKSDFDR